MLVGMSYNVVRDAWVGYSKKREYRLVATGNGAGMTRGDLTSLLLRLGGARASGYIVFQRRYISGMVFGGHWIVVSGGRIYDPDTTPN